MKSFLESAMEVLRTARAKAGSVAKLAEATGVNPVTLGRWFTGERKPTVAEIGKVFDHLGITLAEPGVDQAEYAMIPKVAAKAGTGNSPVAESEVQGYYAFRRSFLRRLGIHEKHSLMLDVAGDSMQPLIMNGDTILVDQSQTTPQEGKIFLMGLGEELLVKLLQKTPRGWLLVSQNPDYAPMPVEGRDLENLRVYGRVRWFGRVV